MNVTEVLAEIAARLDTIPKLNVFPYWAKKVPVPGVTVGLPERIEYDQTKGRGSDACDVPVIVLVGAVSSAASARELNLYMDGDGDRSFAAVLDSGPWESCDDVHVVSAEPGAFDSGGVTLLGAEFTLRVFGQGATS